MPTLGIIVCTVLSDELVHLSARDLEVSKGAVVDNKEGRKLAGMPGRRRACERVDLVEADRLGSRTNGDEGSVLWGNSPEMHNSQNGMRNALSSEIKPLSGSVDCILQLYGQCRCQTLDIEALEEIGIPVLADERSAAVDDCVYAIMGSSDRYLRAMGQHKGAFFITPGYVGRRSVKAEGKDVIELLRRSRG